MKVIVHTIDYVITWLHISLGPRPKTNPSADRFQYPCIILEAIYAPDEVWGRG